MQYLNVGDVELTTTWANSKSPSSEIPVADKSDLTVIIFRRDYLLDRSAVLTVHLGHNDGHRYIMEICSGE